MTVIDFLENVFKPKSERTSSSSVSANSICMELEKELWCYRLSVVLCVEKIASIISNLEWQTMEKKKKDEETEANGESWWLFNYEPNHFQNGTEFKKEMATKLLLNRECLVIEDKGKLYVADSFDINYPYDNSLSERMTFTNVTVNLYGGNIVTLNRTFTTDDAIYMRYQNPNIDGIYQKMASIFSELIENTKKIGNSNVKYTLNIDTIATAGLSVDLQKEIQRIVNEDFKALASGDNVIMPLYNGFNLEPLNQGNNNAQMTSIANKSINEEIEQVLLYVSRGYNIPYDIILGQERDGSYITLMTFCVDPIVTNIETAFNRGYYGKMLMFKGKRLKINTRNARHFEIFGAGSSFSQLISSGVMSINNILDMLDMPKIEPELGDKHWITRNYAEVGNFVQEISEYNEKVASGEEVSTTGGGLK